MHRFHLILVFLFTLQYVGLAQSRSGKDFALFFANDNYQDNSNFLDLKNPVKDAKTIAQELQDMYNFEDVMVYENFSKEEIFEVLEAWMQRNFQAKDQLFIFFSGHGTFREFTKKGYFVPNSERTDYSAYIELTDLGNIITQIPCDHILLAIDACYSGSIDQAIAFRSGDFSRPGETDATRLRSLVDRQLRNPSRLLLTSGGKERTPDGKDHSPFAGAIISGLRNAYTSGDGVLIFQELLGQLERLEPRPHHGTLPQHEQGGFVFVANNAQIAAKGTITPAGSQGERSFSNSVSPRKPCQ